MAINYLGMIGNPMQQRSTSSVSPVQWGQALGGMVQQAKQQEQQQAMMQQAQQALQSRDPNAISQLMLTNPELAKQVQGGIQFQNEATRQNLVGSIEEVLTNPGNTEQILTERINMIDAAGGDSTQSRAALAEYKTDPEGFMRNAEIAYSIYAPDKYKSYASAKTAGQPEAMTAYQQATIEGKKVDQELRRLEIEEKRIDRQLKRETDRLRREELEQKLSENQARKVKAENEAKSSMDSTYSGVVDTLNLVDAIEGHEGFSSAVGIQSAFPTIPGSKAAGVEGMIETLSSQNFLNSIQNMKGMGALSDAEGKKLSSAVASLNTNMSEKDFKKALNVIRGITNRAKSKIESNYRSKGFDVPSVENVYAEQVQPEQSSGYQMIGNYRVRAK